MLKKLLILGILGALCSLIGDFLLGWLVYPHADNHYLAMLASCEDLSYARLGLSVLFGGIGIPMQAFGFWSISQLMHRSKDQKIIQAGSISTATMGGAVHILCVGLMLGMKMASQSGFEVLEATSLWDAIPASLLQFCLWGMLPFTLVMMLPYMMMAITMFMAILKQRTSLPRWMCILNPLMAKVLLNGVAILSPNSYLSNALGMANMALGGLIPFVGVYWYLKIKGEK